MKLTHPSGRSIDVEASDAGPYLSQGWVEGTVEVPAKNASTADWRAYAEQVGFDGDPSGMSRDDLIAALA